MMKASILARTREVIARVHPYVFGQFVEHFPGQIYGGVFDETSPYSDGAGFRTDVVRALSDLAVPIIRWPGGCYASGYHWQWGAGPRESRRTRPSPCWKFQDSNRFGTPEFIDLCRRVGAEPVICVGVGRKERHPTPEEAAGWVRYCNATEGPEAELRKTAGFPEPFDVTLWGLGNEVFAGIYDRAEDYGEDLLAFASRMREADPRLRFIIVGAEQQWLADWNERLLANDDVVRGADWIAWHDYLHTGMCESRPDGAGKRKPYGEVMEHLDEVEQMIAKLKLWNRAASERAGRHTPLQIAVDEWNELGWELFDDIPKNDLPETYTLAHAMYTAGFLNAMIRHAADVSMANYSPAVNTRGLIYAGQHGVLLRAPYHVFKMYRAAAGGTALRAEVLCPRLPGSRAQVLDVAVVLEEGNEVRVLAVNRHPVEPIECRIDFDGIKTDGGTGEVLTADSLDSFNDFEEPARVAPRTVQLKAGIGGLTYEAPARSVSVLRLRATPGA